MRATAAVDEGRNPYGLPGHGNADEVWRRLTAIPCPDCGATAKHLVIDGRNATIICGHQEPPPAQSSRASQ